MFRCWLNVVFCCLCVTTQIAEAGSDNEVKLNCMDITTNAQSVHISFIHSISLGLFT